MKSEKIGIDNLIYKAEIINSDWIRDLNVRLDTMNSLLLNLLIASLLPATIDIF